MIVDFNNMMERNNRISPWWEIDMIRKVKKEKSSGVVQIRKISYKNLLIIRMLK